MKNTITTTIFIMLATAVFLVDCANKALIKHQAPLAKQITLSAIFSDNMVVQREKEISVWGKATPGGLVTVKMANQVKSTTTGQNREWKIILDKMKAGGPFTMEVIGQDTIRLQNVMVGEVWIASGQSNMEMPIKGNWAEVYNCDEEIQNANYPNIRLLTAKRNTAVAPLEDIITTGWVECSPQTISEFSAVAYFFGKDIYKSINVPIGLIHSSWGGTIAEAWTSGQSLKKLEDFVKSVEAIENGPRNKEELQQKYERDLKNWYVLVNEKDPGIEAGDTVWCKVDIDDSNWQQMKLPGLWEENGLSGLDGVVWFRKTINIPDSLVGKAAKLNIGPCDDIDITWFNGVKVGSDVVYNKPRRYEVPGNIIKSGKNIITVRVQDDQGGGGIWGEVKDYSFISSNGAEIPLAGQWRYHVGLDFSVIPPKPRNPNNPNRPTVLYNAMIYPLIPFKIRGAIWYQGESNAGRAYQYRSLFQTLINDWRKNWAIGDFPFYFVQLANFMAKKDEPANDDWAELREAQKMALSLPNTGMAVAIDIGDAKDIHPRNKQDVGRRLALWARAKDYGEKIEYSGPLYDSMKIEGNSIRIHFTHATGLQAKGSKTLTGFAIAGHDKKFYWAYAKIEGNSIVVHNPKVTNPVAVRYAWESNPDCNLYNHAGLPASPFRTDDWPGNSSGIK